MKQYLRLLSECLNLGITKTNRTGVDHIGYQGDMCKYNLSHGFPLVTTCEKPFKSIVAEMLGHLRGYSNAAEFRSLGCKVWDANANENQQWLNNPNRNGEDDLGRIYGTQARNWVSVDSNLSPVGVDQLRDVVDKIKNGIDDRRLIVTHWNPGELTQMALPPCHLLYQFGIEENRLNMCLYQRSCDVPLGIPFNVAGYAWLLEVISHITNYEPGMFTHFMWDIHIYENQVGGVKEQLKRTLMPLPKMYINEKIQHLTDLETWVTPDDFNLVGYTPHPKIEFPFSV